MKNDKATMFGLWLGDKVKSFRRLNRKILLFCLLVSNGKRLTQKDVWGDEI